jgi:hypothetical protein
MPLDEAQAGEARQATGAGIGRHGDLHIGQNIRRGRARRISGPGHDLLVAQRRLQRAGPGGQGRRRQIGEEQDGHALSFL